MIEHSIMRGKFKNFQSFFRPTNHVITTIFKSSCSSLNLIVLVPGRLTGEQTQMSVWSAMTPNFKMQENNLVILRGT